MNCNNDCKCETDKNNDIKSVCVGYAFVVSQELGETYDPQTALCNGTMFPELNIPFGCYVPKQTEGGCCNA